MMFINKNISVTTPPYYDKDLEAFKRHSEAHQSRKNPADDFKISTDNHPRPLSHREGSICAFTLAETLIALVIVGVVAALTVPSLITKYQEQQTITRLNAAYTILSQALKMAEIHNGKIITWDIGEFDTQEGSKKLYNYLAPEIKKLKDCGQSSGCFADSYKTLQGTDAPYQPNTWSRYSRGILNNGVSFLVWSGGSGCNNKYGTNYCGNIRVDINGNKKPNRYGYDFFSFNITTEGLIPPGKTNDAIEQWCNHSGTGKENGMNCTSWVLYKKNFDYKYKNIAW